MEKNIKNEFKDFISTLSTEICKQVLLEELKGINNSFEKTEKDYKSLYVNYTKNINNIKSELEQLQMTNQKLDKFINNINDNNINIDKALDLINGEHKVINDKIIKDNNRIFNEFSSKAKSLNLTERTEFIAQLTSSMDSHSKKYASELSKIVNGNKIELMERNLTMLLSKINIIDCNIKDLNALVKHKCLENEKSLTSKIKDTNSKVEAVSKAVDNRIIELSYKIDKNNKIMTILISVIIILCIILIFKR